MGAHAGAWVGVGTFGAQGAHTHATMPTAVVGRALRAGSLGSPLPPHAGGAVHGTLSEISRIGT